MDTITINDVADRAGVSIKTVSRVLNREPHVREATRDRVLKAVDELGYRPNFAARALAGSRAYLIGLYYDNPSSNYSANYVSDVQFGAMETCRENGYHIVVEYLGDGEPERLLAAVKMDGVILTPPVCDRLDVLELLERRGLPYVRIAPSANFERGPYVYMDDRRAAYDMTAYLVSLGHRRLGFIKGHAGHSATPLRYQGYREAMSDAGVDVEPNWVQTGNFSFRSGFGAAERLLSLPQRPTAVFASNDDMALAVMAVANRMQMSVPQDLSVAGFDDTQVAQVVWPQLTTIRQPVPQMAAAAAEILIKGLPNEAENGVRLDFSLVVRGSTGRSARPDRA